jgi:micrococcal nuclease
MDRMKRLMPASMMLTVGLALAGCGDENQSRVTDVIDGDTVEVAIGVEGEHERVRLIGIDAPERGECGYGEAGGHLFDLVDGKTVNLDSDPSQADRDRYGRLLRYVFVGSDNVNEAMVADGYAREYTYAELVGFFLDPLRQLPRARQIGHGPALIQCPVGDEKCEKGFDRSGGAPSRGGGRPSRP